ncbi:MAG: hypothetical protein ACRD0Z_00625 [Acidimicrobiales bacterium]
MKLSNAPLRAATGAYILNAGVTLLEEREERAADLQKAAMTTYRPLERLKPEQFAYLLAGSEALLGAALLTPIVKPRIAGLGLVAFSSALLGMYASKDHLRRSSSSWRPSREGEGPLKDAWMLGIGLALLSQRRPRPRSHSRDNKTTAAVS